MPNTDGTKCKYTWGEPIMSIPNYKSLSSISSVPQATGYVIFSHSTKHNLTEILFKICCSPTHIVSKWLSTTCYKADIVPVECSTLLLVHWALRTWRRVMLLLRSVQPNQRVRQRQRQRMWILCHKWYLFLHLFCRKDEEDLSPPRKCSCKAKAKATTSMHIIYSPMSQVLDPSICCWWSTSNNLDSSTFSWCLGPWCLTPKFISP